jgi:hypothetical protein
MTEAEFQAAVEKKCQEYQLDFWHSTRADPGLKGMPDLIIIGRCKLIWRELKRSQYEKLEGAQSRLFYKLRGAYQDCEIWIPEDLLSGKIDRELALLNHSI